MHNLVDDLVERRIDREEAAQRLGEIAAARHPSRRPVVTAARASLAASVALLLGAGWPVLLAAFGATVVIDLLNGWLHRKHVPVVYQNVAGGFVATTVVLGLVAAEASFCHRGMTRPRVQGQYRGQHAHHVHLALRCAPIRDLLRPLRCHLGLFEGRTTGPCTCMLMASG